MQSTNYKLYKIISIPASNTITTKSGDSCGWLLGTISRPYDHTIKSTHLPTMKLEFLPFINYASGSEDTEEAGR